MASPSGEWKLVPLLEAPVEAWSRLRVAAGVTGRDERCHRPIEVIRADEEVGVHVEAQRRVGIVQVRHRCAFQ